jgi:3-oxoacyl-[acyl-carrier protein] reductase
MDLELKNKNAVIFGASSGIGLSIAKALKNEGANVAICSRSQERLDLAAKEIGDCLAFTADLSKENSSAEFLDKVLKEWGHVDIMVTNTGGPKKGNFLDISLDQWKEDYQSLWLSVVESLHKVLPLMSQNKFGRIIMITSIAAREPLDGLTTSNGLRAGLSGLCKSISSEVARDNITLNSILPGLTNTERLKALNYTDDLVNKLVPAQRMAHPDELGDLACFLASEKSGYITGQNFVIDGGMTKSY